MKVLLYTYGTRGDVEPYVALARALNEAGHCAVLAAPAAFEPLAVRHGVRFVPRPNGFLELMDDPRYRQAIQNHGARELTRDEVDELRPLAARMRERIFPAMLESLSAAAEADTDLVVHKGEHAQHIAERLGVPSVLGVLQPFTVPSRHYPASPVRLVERPPRTRYRLDHLRARLRGIAPDTRAAVERWRADVLGLRRRRGMHDASRQPDGTPTVVLHGFSRHLAPSAPDWPAHVHTTGYWYLPQEEPLLPRLDAFLDAGPPPVVFGFGSLANADPRRIGRLVREVVRRTGVRAVVVTAGGSVELSEPVEDALIVDQAPYGRLFPRCRAVVHAGGLGTAQHALVAALPQVTCPLQPEQLAWSRFLHWRGVAPAPLPQRDLNADALTVAVRMAVHDRSLSAGAHRLGTLVRAEPGVRLAVRLLEDVHARTANREAHADVGH